MEKINFKKGMSTGLIIGLVVLVLIVIGIFIFAGNDDSLDDENVGDDSDTPADVGGAGTYRVTIENLTEGQPLSPGVIVTHSSGVDLWGEGVAASAGIKAIAEDGNPAVASAALSGLSGVTSVVTIDAPTHRIGGPDASTQSFMIDAEDGDMLSLAVMLICTNDGFTGVSSMSLPVTSVVQTALAYDAGTEDNDELYTSIVDACGAAGPVAHAEDGNGGTATVGGSVASHPGIQGSGDLTTSDHGWSGAVARITVEKI